MSGTNRTADSASTLSAPDPAAPPSSGASPAPFLAKLSSVVQPNLFWAVRLPSPGDPPSTAKALARLLALEAELAALYNTGARPKGGVSLVRRAPGQFADADVVPGRWGAVRPSHQSPLWYRAKVVSAATPDGRGPLCRVFLVDHGVFLDGVVARVNLRALPMGMRALKPLAFQLIVGGENSKFLPTAVSLILK